MSYKIALKFKCELCGREEVGMGYQLTPFFVSSLPERWFGSRFKYGACYCPECRDAICEVKFRGKR